MRSVVLMISTAGRAVFKMQQKRDKLFAQMDELLAQMDELGVDAAFVARQKNGKPDVRFLSGDESVMRKGLETLKPQLERAVRNESEPKGKATRATPSWLTVCAHGGFVA